jgi:hypothetical protein
MMTESTVCYRLLSTTTAAHVKIARILPRGRQKIFVSRTRKHNPIEHREFLFMNRILWKKRASSETPMT